MASGIYHKHNALLYRVLEIMFDKYPDRICARELANELGVEPTDITDRVQSYVKFRYLRRSKKKYIDSVTGRKVRLLSISRMGGRTYIQLKHRINLGFDLNRRRTVPRRVDSYFGVTKHGALDLGVTAGDIEKMNLLLKHTEGSGDEDEEDEAEEEFDEENEEAPGV